MLLHCCYNRALSKPLITGLAREDDAAVTRRGIDRGHGRGHDGAMPIFKIFRRSEWDDFRAAGRTAGAPVDLADGFIHFSTAAQVAETAAKHFATESDLVLVAVDPDRLGPALRWEPSRGGQLFPHLYRELRLDDVLWDKSLPLGSAGHIFPEGML